MEIKVEGLRGLNREKKKEKLFKKFNKDVKCQIDEI